MKEHWTASYLRHRMLLWIDQKQHLDDPWLNRRIIEILDSSLTLNDIGFEFGSGRSTLWIAQRIKHLTSVESDEVWFNQISNKIVAQELKNICYQFRPICADDETESVQEYVNCAYSVMDQSLDFALVDGRLRDRCAMTMLPKLKPGVLLVIDNIERYIPSSSRSPEALGPDSQPVSQVWVSFLEMVSTWRKIWTTNGVTDCCLWIKPAKASRP